MERPKVYVASPLGFNAIGRVYMRSLLYPAIEKLGFEVLDPWAWQLGKSDKEINAMNEVPLRLEDALGLGNTNIKEIKNCNIMVAVLDGSDIDSGVSSEIALASEIGKPVFGLYTDFRKKGDSELGINLQVAAFIFNSGGEVYRTLDELLTKLSEFGKRFQAVKKDITKSKL